jgi:hypothetical protein
MLPHPGAIENPLSGERSASPGSRRSAPVGRGRHEAGWRLPREHSSRRSQGGSSPLTTRSSLRTNCARGHAGAPAEQACSAPQSLWPPTHPTNSGGFAARRSRPGDAAELPFGPLVPAGRAGRGPRKRSDGPESAGETLLESPSHGPLAARGSAPGAILGSAGDARAGRAGLVPRFPVTPARTLRLILWVEGAALGLRCPARGLPRTGSPQDRAK